MSRNHLVTSVGTDEQARLEINNQQFDVTASVGITADGTLVVEADGPGRKDIRVEMETDAEVHEAAIARLD